MMIKKIIDFLNNWKSIIFVEPIKSMDFADEKIQQAVYPTDKDPVAPYVVKYNSHLYYTQQDGLKIDEDQFNTLQREITSVKNFLSEDKEPVLKKMYDDMVFIYNQLKPLEKLGLEIDLDITGGAIRDFVLNKHHEIKDLDVMISFANNVTKNKDHNFTDLSKYSLIKSEKLKSIGFSQEDLDAVKWSDDGVDLGFNYKINQLVHLCFLNTGAIEKTYLHSTPNQNGHLENHVYTEVNDNVERLSGVIKLNKSKTNLEIDLLITPQNKKEFRECFDFDFCKASIAFINKYTKKSFPKHHSHLISRFTADQLFYASVFNQKISLNLDIERSLKSSPKRYIKFVEKYPDYQLHLYGIVSPLMEKSEEKRQAFSSEVSYMQLTKKIGQDSPLETKTKSKQKI